MQTTIIGCSNATEIAKKIAGQLRAEYSELFTEHFPDGELHIRDKT